MFRAILTALLLLASPALGQIKVDPRYEPFQPIVVEYQPKEIPPDAKLKIDWVLPAGCNTISIGPFAFHAWAPPGTYELAIFGVWAQTKEIDVGGQKVPVLVDFGAVNQRASFVVGVPPPPPDSEPKVDTFSATPSSGDSGFISTVRWSVSPSSSSVVLSSANYREQFPAAGEKQLQIMSTQDIVLTATNGTKTATRSVKVTVNTPPAPIQRDGLYVLIVMPTDPAELAKLPREQVQVAQAGEVDAYLMSKCATDGAGTKAYRRLAPDADLSREDQVWRDAMQVPHAGINPPYWIVSNGKAGVVEALPKTVAEAMATLRKYGG